MPKFIRSLRAGIELLRERGFPHAAQVLEEASRLRPLNSAWTHEACDDWKHLMRGTPPGGEIGKNLKPIVAEHEWMNVRPVWRYALTEGRAYLTPARFADRFGYWQTLAIQHGAMPPPVPTNTEASDAPRIEPNAARAWGLALVELRRLLPEHVYTTWFQPTFGVSLNGTLEVAIPCEEKTWRLYCIHHRREVGIALNLSGIRNKLSFVHWRWPMPEAVAAEKRKTHAQAARHESATPRKRAAVDERTV